MSLKYVGLRLDERIVVSNRLLEYDAWSRFLFVCTVCDTDSRTKVKLQLPHTRETFNCFMHSANFLVPMIVTTTHEVVVDGKTYDASTTFDIDPSRAGSDKKMIAVSKEGVLLELPKNIIVPALRHADHDPVAV